MSAPWHKQVLLALEALDNGGCISCAAFLSLLSEEAVAGLEAALRGEIDGCMVQGGVYQAPEHGEAP